MTQQEYQEVFGGSDTTYPLMVAVMVKAIKELTEAIKDNKQPKTEGIVEKVIQAEIERLIQS